MASADQQISEPGQTSMVHTCSIRAQSNRKFMGRISKAFQLTEHYTNHCIRVTGATNLTRSGKFTAKQIMSVAGHKSLQSLATYQRVHSDEKLMMGMNLTYGPYHPTEVEGIQQIIQKMIEEKNNAPVPMPRSALTIKSVPEVAVLEPHALDPNVPKILPPESALIPYQKPDTPNQENVINDGFDLMNILAEFDAPDDDQLMMAMTQIEKENTKATTTIMKNRSMWTLVYLAF